MHSLPLATRESLVIPVLAEMVEKQEPGFQIAPPEGETDAALAVLAEGMRRLYTPDFCFNVDVAIREESLISDVGEHIDDDLFALRTGIAAHVNYYGEGDVYLALGSWFQRKRFINTMQRIEFMPRRKGSQYHGALSEGIITVFSEGLALPSGRRLLPPAFHQFVSSPGQVRQWSRYTYEPTRPVHVLEVDARPF